MKRAIHAPLALACALLLVLQAACAHREAPKEETVRAKNSEYEQLFKPRSFSVTPSPYLGSKSVPLTEEDAPILSKHVVMKSKGTLRDVVAALGRLVPSLTFTLAASDDHAKAPSRDNLHKAGQGQAKDKELKAGETAEPSIEELLAGDPASLRGLADLDTGKTLEISYKGPLKGLLNQIGAQSGYGWDYDKATGSVVIGSLISRTFQVNVMPGTSTYSLNLTNRAKTESSNSSSGTSNVRSTVTQEGNDSQTTQTASRKMTVDAWKEILENVRMLCSSKGKAAGSMSSGTVTVHDHPDNIRKIRRYIESVNGIYLKQVAMKVNVYSLVLKDSNSAGFDISAVFTNNPAVDIVAGALSMAKGSNDTASITILKGDLAGSAAVLKALKKWGDATEITSGGLVARNNVPTPLQALRKFTYVAGSSSETTDYGQNMSITPGEVTTGFSMTVLPHILSGRRVMLNCDVTLAYLESLQSFRSGATTVQLPQTSTRAFSQSAVLQQGQTLVLAGYQQAAQEFANTAGILNMGRTTDFSKNILIITIQLENAAPELAGRPIEAGEGA